MRVRQLSPSGDMQFGQGQQNFLYNVPGAPAQVVQTTLQLWLGEFFLDVNAGTPYVQGVIGKNSQQTADLTLQTQIANCQGVTNISNYQSTVDPNTRTYSSISGTINTLYGEANFSITYY